MPLERNKKPAGEFSEGGSYPTTGDGVKRVSKPWNRINGIYEKFTGKDLQFWTKEEREKVVANESRR